MFNIQCSIEIICLRVQLLRHRLHGLRRHRSHLRRRSYRHRLRSHRLRSYRLWKLRRSYRWKMNYVKRKKNDRNHCFWYSGNFWKMFLYEKCFSVNGVYNLHAYLLYWFWFLWTKHYG